MDCPSNQTKSFISDSMETYTRVVKETPTHYFCDNNVIFAKKDVLTDYYPLDDLRGILHLHVVQFMNY